MMKVHYHDGTTEEYPPAPMAADEMKRFGSAGWRSSTRDGVLSIEYGQIFNDRTVVGFAHHVLIPLVSIRRIEQ